MSKKKTYQVHTAESRLPDITSDGTVAESRFAAENSSFERLTADLDNDFFIFEWRYANSRGKVKIPEHIVFAIPDLLTALNDASERAIMEPHTISVSTPVATLFNRPYKRGSED